MVRRSPGYDSCFLRKKICLGLCCGELKEMHVTMKSMLKKQESLGEKVIEPIISATVYNIDNISHEFCEVTREQLKHIVNWSGGL